MLWSFTTPLLNSHTGAAALNPEQPQLLPDALIRAIADQGGVLSIHFMSQMVKPGRHKATFDELMAQFEYIANLVGTDHIACLWSRLSLPRPSHMGEPEYLSPLYV